MPMSRSSSTFSSDTWIRSARSGSSFREKMPRVVRGTRPKWMASGAPRVRPSATLTGSMSPIRSPTLVSGVASFSPYRSLACRQLTGRSSPSSAASRRQRAQAGAEGGSLISQPATTGVHSSSSPDRVRISRVLPWPRSPSRMMSCPAIRARSRCGCTVWPKPTMPGNGSCPDRSMASRFCLISALTLRWECPLARSPASVVMDGAGDWLSWCTIRGYVVIAGMRIWPRSHGWRRNRRGSGTLGAVAITPEAARTVRSDDVIAARNLLRDVISETPMMHSRVLSEAVAGPVFLECEDLQRTASFKVRGAYTRIARLSDAERARGVVAASAGNHAQGVAFAAGLLGCEAAVFMPQGAPLPKIQATRGYGADVMLTGTCVEDALIAALAHAEQTGAVFIHPFDHPDVVTGQGTLGFEIVEQCPQVRTVVVPVGGGGMAAGVAVAIKSLDPAIGLVGVQAEQVAPYPASLAAGHPMTVQAGPTMADGIAVSRPGDVPFGILSDLAERVITVSEESLSRALLLCLERAKQVVEPAGAAGVAALLEHARDLAPPVVVVLSGGNIDPLLLAKLLRHGLSAAARHPAFRCRLPDHPGSLAKLLGDLADLGANVLEVGHERLAPRLHVDEVEVVLQVETRGPEHCGEVIGALRAAGYTLAFT